VATSTEAPPRTLVVDCSICLPWFLADERSKSAERLLGRLDHFELWAPPIWPLELANALDLARRRRRLAAEDWRRALANADRLPVRVDPRLPGVAEIGGLAERHGLTTYDASYLELALRRRFALATADADLARAAREAGVELLTD
jgi:predicted nucleic acid-binding protein